MPQRQVQFEFVLQTLRPQVNLYPFLVNSHLAISSAHTFYKQQTPSQRYVFPVKSYLYEFPQKQHEILTVFIMIQRLKINNRLLINLSTQRNYPQQETHLFRNMPNLRNHRSLYYLLLLLLYHQPLLLSYHLNSL